MVQTYLAQVLNVITGDSVFRHADNYKKLVTVISFEFMSAMALGKKKEEEIVTVESQKELCETIVQILDDDKLISDPNRVHEVPIIVLWEGCNFYALENNYEPPRVDDNITIYAFDINKHRFFKFYKIRFTISCDEDLNVIRERLLKKKNGGMDNLAAIAGDLPEMPEMEMREISHLKIIEMPEMSEIK